MAGVGGSDARSRAIGHGGLDQAAGAAVREAAPSCLHILIIVLICQYNNRYNRDMRSIHCRNYTNRTAMFGLAYELGDTCTRSTLT